MLCVPLSLHNIALCTPKSEMTTYQCDSDVIEGSLTVKAGGSFLGCILF